MKSKRIVAFLLCVLTIVGVMPFGTALAAESTVTIESQTNSAFDYLEYYKDGTWHDLNTPRHWIESTGQICYCVEHSEGNPHGATYTAASPSSVFSASTLAGMQSILMYGYPCNTPSGFTADEARQATANALRFWLSENGESGSYSFTNRKANPNYIRAKSGYEHVLDWADELLSYARAHKILTHSITFTPSSLTLASSGNSFVGQTQVKLTNINSGYTLNSSNLPSGVSISGYTGSANDTLTITAPESAMGQSFTITATGKDTRSLNNITAYVPSDGNLQKIFLCATTAQVVATASIGVDTPAYGYLKIAKTGENGAALAGVQFGVYSDAGCTQKLCELTTGSDGTVTSGTLPAGTVYVKELFTVSPYVIDNAAKTVTISINKTTTLNVENITAKGQICINKTAEQMTDAVESSSDYGTVYFPKYTEAGLAGCVFEVKDASGKTIANLTTDANGYAETGILEFGTYTVQEVSAVEGYVADDTVHTVTLAYQDQNTPIVKENISVKNGRIPASVKIKKMTERWNQDEFVFEPCAGEGFVFGLYTAESIGILPKDTLVELLTTDAEGSAASAELPFGNYYLRELKVPDETIYLSQTSFPLSVSGVNTVYYDDPIVNDMFKGNIAVCKTDETDADRMLAGAVFEIRGEDDVLYDTIITDEDGYAISIDLPVGTYHVKEIGPPTGFILSDEVTEITISTDNKSTAVLERANKANEMTLKKSDITNGMPVPDATITIYDASGAVFFEGKTDENGEIYLSEVPAGKYTYKETIAPYGYAMNTETFSFEMDNYGKVTGTTEITDEPIVLKLTKMNTFTGKPFANIEFSLKDTDGNTVKTVMTENGYRIVSADGEDSFKVDESGYAEFQYLAAGDYSLVEGTPLGYISEDVYSFTLTDSYSLSSPFELTVENCPTGLKISKVDSATDRPLMGAGFRIKVRDGLGFETLTFTQQEDGSFFYDANGTVMDMMVDGNGEIMIYGLPLGNIWIEESIVPDGYFPNPAAKVEITKNNKADNPYEITIKNSKYVKLGMDSDWWEFPALLLGIALAIGGVVLVVIKRKKLKKVED